MVQISWCGARTGDDLGHRGLALHNVNLATVRPRAIHLRMHGHRSQSHVRTHHSTLHAAHQRPRAVGGAPSIVREPSDSVRAHCLLNTVPKEQPNFRWHYCAGYRATAGLYKEAAEPHRFRGEHPHRRPGSLAVALGQLHAHLHAHAPAVHEATVGVRGRHDLARDGVRAGHNARGRVGRTLVHLGPARDLQCRGAARLQLHHLRVLWPACTQLLPSGDADCPAPCLLGCVHWSQGQHGDTPHSRHRNHPIAHAGELLVSCGVVKIALNPKHRCVEHCVHACSSRGGVAGQAPL